jgi:hypothetical protein
MLLQGSRTCLLLLSKSPGVLERLSQGGHFGTVPLFKHRQSGFQRLDSYNLLGADSLGAGTNFFCRSLVAVEGEHGICGVVAVECESNIEVGIGWNWHHLLR